MARIVFRQDALRHFTTLNRPRPPPAPADCDTRPWQCCSEERRTPYPFVQPLMGEDRRPFSHLFGDQGAVPIAPPREQLHQIDGSGLFMVCL
jgi:hypothetical protein